MEPGQVATDPAPLSVSVFLTRIASELADLSHQAQSLETTLGQIGGQTMPSASGAKDIQELDRITQTLECLSGCVSWAAAQGSLDASVDLNRLIETGKMHSVLRRLRTGQRYADLSGETADPELF